MQSYPSHQSLVMASAGQVDITPPIGIYHRMWGAAKHDRAESVHKPLKATMVLLQPNEDRSDELTVIVGLDHCILDSPDVELFRDAISKTIHASANRVMICLSHTHAAGLMSRSRSDLPGGEQIGSYLDSIADELANLARSLLPAMQEATFIFGTGRCDLARERDYWDQAQSHYVCGFNPLGTSDDTLVVGKLVGKSGQCMASLVNYACHPTTLAWDNRAISPDFVGAMRELVEEATGAPCLFLQGASGDLGPRNGFVGDTEVADQNGRQLGYCALSVLESLTPPQCTQTYSGSVLSGTRIGTWKYTPWNDDERSAAQRFDWREFTIGLAYRSDLVGLAETNRMLAEWREKSNVAKRNGDSTSESQSRAMVEQLQRQVWRLESLPPGDQFPFKITILEVGSIRFLFVSGEHYQVLQQSIRQRYPNQLWVVSTISNGWQPGYLPPSTKYGYGIYQEAIALLAAGSAEKIIDSI